MGPTDMSNRPIGWRVGCMTWLRFRVWARKDSSLSRRWRVIHQPSTRYLKSICLANNDSILNGSENEVCTRAEGHQRCRVSVELCEIHVTNGRLDQVPRFLCKQTTISKMPPMAFNGIVTKAGFMNKTATVTVSRRIIHKLTGKVRLRCKCNLMRYWPESSANWTK